MAVADDAHGLLAVQELGPLLDVDVEVLGGVVVVHVPGHVELHAVHRVHDLPYGLPLDDHIPVRHHAGEAGHLLFQVLQSAAAGLLGAVYAVDLLDGPWHVHRGIPGDAHHVHLLVGHVVGDQDDGVRTAGRGVLPQEEEGVVVLLPAGEGFIRLVLVPLGGGGGAGSGGAVRHAGAVVVRHVRRLDEDHPRRAHRRRKDGDTAEDDEGRALAAALLPLFFLLFLVVLLKGVSPSVPAAGGGLPLAFAHVSFPFR